MGLQLLTEKAVLLVVQNTIYAEECRPTNLAMMAADNDTSRFHQVEARSLAPQSPEIQKNFGLRKNHDRITEGEEEEREGGRGSAHRMRRRLLKRRGKASDNRYLFTKCNERQQPGLQRGY